MTKFCSDCGAASESLTSVFDDCLVCQTCLDANYCQCHVCGEFYPRYDLNYRGYCPECQGQWLTWRPTFRQQRHNTTKTIASDRCFGVELETSDCPNHARIKSKTCFGCKEDCSIDGLEFESPILRGDKGLASIKKFCKLAHEYNFDVNEQCGFHLHIDMRGTSEEQRRHIVYAYKLTERLWRDLTDECRWDNGFCDLNPLSREDIKNGRVCWSRNQFLNTCAYSSHKTFELRGYQGTLDATEICNWVKAHIAFIEFVEDMDFDELDRLFNSSEAQENICQIIGDSLSHYYARSWAMERVAV
jgi:hypothetical protein